MSNPIRLTAKMLNIRDTMRNFWGDEYQARIEPFREAISRWMRETGKGAAECGLAACRKAEDYGNEMDVLLAIAATVEECERPTPGAGGAA